MGRFRRPGLTRLTALLALASAATLAIPTLLLLGGHRSAPLNAPRSAPYDEPIDGLVPPRPHPTPPPSPAGPSPAAALAAAPSPPPPARPGGPPPPVVVGGVLPNFSHVFTIVMENHEYGTILGNPAAPYLNGLARTYGLATNYYGAAHPSLPNYLALTAGSTFGITSDCTGCFVSAANIADQVEASGRSWRAYMEDLPAPCFLGPYSAGYALKHDPFLYYTDIRNNPARCAHVVPFTRFSADLAAGAVPNYAWITPNLCHDMHDCGVGVGDAWLARVVPSILASPAWRAGGVLFLTFDEGASSAGCCGDSYGGHVVTLVISPLGRRGFRSGVAENHFSLLRAVEDAWHLGDLRAAGCACTARMSEFF